MSVHETYSFAADVETLTEEVIYEGLDRPVKRTSSATGSEVYLHYNRQPLLRHSPDRNETVTWTQNPVRGLPLAATVNGETFALHYDYLGSCILVTDEAGSVVWEAKYSAFGEVQVVSDTLSVELPQAWAGYHYDAELGAYHLGYRWYSPRDGRFWGEDLDAYSFLSEMSYNLLCYSNNNFMSYRDYLGQKTEMIIDPWWPPGSGHTYMGVSSSPNGPHFYFHHFDSSKFGSAAGYDWSKETERYTADRLSVSKSMW